MNLPHVSLDTAPSPSALAFDRLLEREKQKGARVLVTGGFGYIGGELVRALARHEIDHISVDAKNPGGDGAVALDLRDRAGTRAVIEGFEPDVVVHCGTHSALAYRDQLIGAFNDDAAALTCILEPLASRPTCRLIYFSSSYVYSGLAPGDPVSESTKLQPSHNFGVAKSFFEQLALRSHPSTVVFRLSSVFGPGNALNPNAVFNMAKECLEAGKLTVWGAGLRRMQYVYMQDVLTYIGQAFTGTPGILNLGGSEYPSVAESAEAIAAFFGAEVAYLRDKKEGDTLPFMDTAKLRHSTNDFFTPFRDSLNEYLGLLQRNHSVESPRQLPNEDTTRR